MLDLELLRLEAFRAGKVGFVSARVSPETIIDIRPIAAGERVTPNIDHDCLVLGPTDMHQVHAKLKAQGVHVEETVRSAWGAQGYGQQCKLRDPDGNTIFRPGPQSSPVLILPLGKVISMDTSEHSQPAYT